MRVVTASARKRPSLRLPISGGRFSIMESTCPPSRSASCAAVALYGIWRTPAPVCAMNSFTPTSLVVPGSAEVMVIRSGCALLAPIRSCRVR
ncbi:Uncharacterised protein [Bordetella pertussis]|nr:Uncharacterised protein [Bordetella pertussis]CFP05609.1 Uncharacterised protein [Bordetella pertussis]CPI60526.1 Uncharacterised protein [Bordetella pertussis]CPJ22916.1 Uncharacterised protein [Bordetella pertussis]CPK42894.1 Uncharacterised protein [Bordetella pertussis]